MQLDHLVVHLGVDPQVDPDIVRTIAAQDDDGLVSRHRLRDRVRHGVDTDAEAGHVDALANMSRK